MERPEDDPVEFPAFPFKPYPIQLEFMRAVYSAIQKGGVAVVESPTGTGKTLSLICSAVQWLLDQHKDRAPPPEGPLNTVVGKTNTSAEEEPDWMSSFVVKNEEKIRNEKGVQKWMLKPKTCQGTNSLGNRTLLSFGNAKESYERSSTRQTESWSVKAKPGLDDDEEFVMEDYCSDEDTVKEAKRKLDCSMSSSSDDDSDDSAGEEPLKVFFCSRTHSQLSQFVGELQRTAFSSSLRTVSLGSRKNLCINPAVAALGSSSRINDKCLELQDKQSKKVASKIGLTGEKSQRKTTPKGCPLLSKRKLQKRFVEEALEGDALDIEDLVELGSKIGTCPYYGSRRMVPVSDLVVLPYQSLLHRATRESLGIKLKDSVVVIDEAHNLVDTISNIHSCQVTNQQLKQVHSQLSDYLEKFRKRLAASNKRYIQMLLSLISSFIRLISSSPEAGKANTRMMTINDFVFSMGIDNLNLFKVRRYIKESNIVHKVSSYGEKFSLQQIAIVGNGAATSGRGSLTGFHMLAEFVLALTNADSDGRVLLMPRTLEDQSLEAGDGSLKFIMLNAAKNFAEVLEEARAVILAGGTLQPVEELRVRLFPHLPEEQVHMFCCGHIVPPESILPLAIARGPSNRTFDFTYQSRSSPSIMEELGRLINNISSVVPEGIVVFFPSFDYENQVFNSWKSAGTLSAIESKKAVFREPRDATTLEEVLRRYRESVSEQEGKKTGALLMCVVGGKMSEGINFSDGMGRCVVMVGLPYPSPSDPELVERMKYIDRLAGAIETGTLTSRSGQKGREYYENLCMKAVNQSIGRAIRHIRDYAAILLVDVRYTSGGIDSGPSSKLPGWIRTRLTKVTGSFGEVHKHLHQFFKYNRLKNMEEDHAGV